MQSLNAEARRAITDASSVLPFPGEGSTSERLHALCGYGQSDLSLARILEAHYDALAILNEAAHEPRQDALYAVWACDAPQSQLHAKLANGKWHLTGDKQFCTGSLFVDAALVTAHSERGLVLFEIALNTAGIHIGKNTWAASAFADTETCPVTFDNVIVANHDLVGSPGWYLQRPGFWHGAIAPAACWAGGAIGLVDCALGMNRQDPHSLAHLGALEAVAWQFNALLSAAGDEIDQDPHDAKREAHRRALIVRHLIERGATEVLDRFGRATGPHLLAFDAHVVQQHAALNLYIRQCHAERDLALIPRKLDKDTGQRDALPRILVGSHRG